MQMNTPQTLTLGEAAHEKFGSWDAMRRVNEGQSNNKQSDRPSKKR